jgi:hypothetical protein
MFEKMKQPSQHISTYITNNVTNHFRVFVSAIRKNRGWERQGRAELGSF